MALFPQTQLGNVPTPHYKYPVVSCWQMVEQWSPALQPSSCNSTFRHENDWFYATSSHLAVTITARWDGKPKTTAQDCVSTCASVKSLETWGQCHRACEIELRSWKPNFLLYTECSFTLTVSISVWYLWSCFSLRFESYSLWWFVT